MMTTPVTRNFDVGTRCFVRMGFSNAREHRSSPVLRWCTPVEVVVTRVGPPLAIDERIVDYGDGVHGVVKVTQLSCDGREHPEQVGLEAVILGPRWRVEDEADILAKASSLKGGRE